MTRKQPKQKSWKDRDPTTVINIMRQALGGPKKYATEYAEKAWKDVWAAEQKGNEIMTNRETAFDKIQLELSITHDFLLRLAKHLEANEMPGQAGNCTLRADALTEALHSLDFVRR